MQHAGVAHRRPGPRRRAEGRCGHASRRPSGLPDRSGRVPARRRRDGPPGQCSNTSAWATVSGPWPSGLRPGHAGARVGPALRSERRAALAAGAAGRGREARTGQAAPAVPRCVPDQSRHRRDRARADHQRAPSPPRLRRLARPRFPAARCQPQRHLAGGRDRAARYRSWVCRSASSSARFMWERVADSIGVLAVPRLPLAALVADGAAGRS